MPSLSFDRTADAAPAAVQQLDGSPVHQLADPDVDNGSVSAVLPQSPARAAASPSRPGIGSSGLTMGAPASDAVVVSGISARVAGIASTSALWQHLASEKTIPPAGPWDTLADAAEAAGGRQGFDAELFGLPTDSAKSLPAPLTALYEVGYETMLDAGVSPWRRPQAQARGPTHTRTQAAPGQPSSVDGSNMPHRPASTAVFLAATAGIDIDSRLPASLARALHLQAPQLPADTPDLHPDALLATVAAANAIQQGLCDSALVLAMSTSTAPSSTSTPTAHCREAVFAIFLQQAAAATHIYCQIPAGAICPFPGSARAASECRRFFREQCDLRMADVVHAELGAADHNRRAAEFAFLSDLCPQPSCQWGSVHLQIPDLAPAASSLLALIKVAMAIANQTPLPSQPMLVEALLKTSQTPPPPTPPPMPTLVLCHVMTPALGSIQVLLSPLQSQSEATRSNVDGLATSISMGVDPTMSSCMPENAGLQLQEVPRLFLYAGRSPRQLQHTRELLGRYGTDPRLVASLLAACAVGSPSSIMPHRGFYMPAVPGTVFHSSAGAMGAANNSTSTTIPTALEAADAVQAQATRTVLRECQAFLGELQPVQWSMGMDKGSAGVRGVGADADSVRRPVWLVFSGMGSQWHGMGQDLLRTSPLFRSAIRRCDQALRSTGFSLLKALQARKPAPPATAGVHSRSASASRVASPQGMRSSASDSAIPSAVAQARQGAPPLMRRRSTGDMHGPAAERQAAQAELPAGAAFACITAIQIALTDMLRANGVVPTRVVGHSMGEVACAYADGALTLEQAMRTSFMLGRFAEGARGAMAVLDMDWDSLLAVCPPTLSPACDTSASCVAVAGPDADVRAFVSHLKAAGTTASLIASAGVAFHSPAIINQQRSLLQRALKRAVPSRFTRSPAWISTSSQPERQCTADYFINNLASPVFFREVMETVPDNAVVIEVAPHALLRKTIEETVAPSVQTLAPMSRQGENSARWASTLGQLYLCGVIDDMPEEFEPDFGGRSLDSFCFGQLVPDLVCWGNGNSTAPDNSTDISACHMDLGVTESMGSMPMYMDIAATRLLGLEVSLSMAGPCGTAAASASSAVGANVTATPGTGYSYAGLDGSGAHAAQIDTTDSRAATTSSSWWHEAGAARLHDTYAHVDVYPETCSTGSDRDTDVDVDTDVDAYGEPTCSPANAPMRSASPIHHGQQLRAVYERDDCKEELKVFMTVPDLETADCTGTLGSVISIAEMAATVGKLEGEPVPTCMCGQSLQQLQNNASHVQMYARPATAFEIVDNSTAAGCELCTGAGHAVAHAPRTSSMVTSTVPHMGSWLRQVARLWTST